MSVTREDPRDLAEASTAERRLVGLWCRDGWQADAAEIMPEMFFDPRWKAVAACVHALRAQDDPVNLENIQREVMARDLVGEGKPLESIADVWECSTQVLGSNDTARSLARQIRDAVGAAAGASRSGQGADRRGE